VVGRGSAAAPHDVQQPFAGEVAHELGHLFGGLVVLAQRIRQASIGVRADPSVDQARQLLDVWSHLRSSEPAVQADGERLGVGDGGPEGIDRLARQGASRRVADRERDEDGELLSGRREHVENGGDRRLAVERVEHGLDQQQIDSTVHEAAHLLGVGRVDLVERHIAIGGILHARRQRERLVQWTDRTGNEARPIRCARGGLVACATGDAGRGDIHLVGDVLEPVVCLRDRCGREGGRLDDVRTGVEIGAVDLVDHVGAREHENVGVSLEISGVVRESRASEVRLGESVALHEAPHGAVEDEDSLREQGRHLLFAIGGVHDLSTRLPRRQSEKKQKWVSLPGCGRWSA
jgi:hypothetical protein